MTLMHYARAFEEDEALARVTIWTWIWDVGTHRIMVIVPFPVGFD